MVTTDLILDGGYTPSYEEIAGYIREPAHGLWQEVNSFIQQKYQVAPRITYSKCSGKPGWNVKYQKTGKSLCTLYPEKDCFIVLVVVTLELVPLIEAISGDFEPEVINVVRTAKPFNGTLWLMISVDRPAVLGNVKELLRLKHCRQRPN